MKNIFIYIAVLTLGLASCNSAKWASADAYPDDIYYNPNDKPLTVSDEFIPVFSEKELKKENNKEARSKQGEYLSDNPNYALEQVTEDLQGKQQSYADILTNDSISDVDTVLYYNDETGYWVNGFNGSQMDLDYATRLIKFHGPFVGVPYWSPLYTDVLFANTWDWNVYVDNNYVYAFPSYTSPFYWNSGFYMGMGMGMGFGFGYGWGSPWYNPWYSPFYPPYYGYYPPYYGYPPYCGPGYGYPPVYGPGYPSDDYHYGPRQGVASSSRMAANSSSALTSPRSDVNKTAPANAVPARTTRTITADNNLRIKNGNTSYTRVARSNQTPQDVVKKSGSSNSRQGAASGEVRTTRRSYSSYSTSRSAKRSTFNRSTTYARPATVSTKRGNTPSKAAAGRVYSAPRRSSYSTFRSSRSSSSGKVKSTSRPTYRTGSSKSSRSSSSSSSYGSSRSKSSFSSSPSRSSRSSGSSFSSPSSSGFSRSSGSSRSSGGGGGGTTRGGRR
jgi:hypothetical protein